MRRNHDQRALRSIGRLFSNHPKRCFKIRSKGHGREKAWICAKATTTHNIFQQFLPYRLRKITKVEEKTKIAAKVMDYIEPEDTIFLDAGSSALAVANELLEKEHISIVTNSICAANLLNDSNHSVYLAGGPCSAVACARSAAKPKASSASFTAKKRSSLLQVSAKIFLLPSRWIRRPA